MGFIKICSSLLLKVLKMKAKKKGILSFYKEHRYIAYSLQNPTFVEF